MTDDTPRPRRWRIIDKAPAGFDPHDSLPVSRTTAAEGSVVQPDHDSDDDIVTGDDLPLSARTGDAASDHDLTPDSATTLLHDADTILPDLPLVNTLLDADLPLDRHTLATAAVIRDEMEDTLDDGEMDCTLAALLLQCIDDIDLRRQYRELLTAEAQDAALALEQALDSVMRHELEDAPPDARQMIFAGLIADIEMLHDQLEDENTAPDAQECLRIARLMQITSAQGDLSPRLVSRACDSFNDLADTAELSVRLCHEGDRVRAQTQDSPFTWKPHPPRP